MEKIAFHLMQLYEVTPKFGERFVHPNPNIFNVMPEFFNILINKFYYEVSVQKNEKYIWFDVNFGSPNPRDEELTNINNGNKKSNPREIIEAELLKQVFCLYHYSKQTLYLSNPKKKKLVEVILKEKTGIDFKVKSFFKTKNEFIELLKSVNEISFTEVRNLFHKDSLERQALIDLTGTDSPDDFTITAKYSKANVISGFLNKLFNGLTNNSLKDLIIRGTDEDNFSIIFNNDTFTKKIDVSSSKDSNGKFSAKSVKSSLLQELNR